MAVEKSAANIEYEIDHALVQIVIAKRNNGQKVAEIPCEMAKLFLPLDANLQQLIDHVLQQIPPPGNEEA